MKALGIVVAYGLSVILSPQTPNTLDLTQVRPSVGSPTEGAAESGSIPGSGPHGLLEKSPLRLTLEWMDRDSYRDGDSFAFRVGIVNVSRAPVTLPWEPDSYRVANDGDVMRMALTLAARTAKGELELPIATLYGSTMDPNSTKLLPPGVRVEILAKGRWRLPEAPSAMIDLPATVDVGARLLFATRIDHHAYESLSSTNRVEVVLDRRARR